MNNISKGFSSGLSKAAYIPKFEEKLAKDASFFSESSHLKGKPCFILTFF